MAAWHDTQALITQTAVCNRHHSVGQQLCRWQLLSLDRLSSIELTWPMNWSPRCSACAVRASPKPG